MILTVRSIKVYYTDKGETGDCQFRLWSHYKSERNSEIYQKSQKQRQKKLILILSLLIQHKYVILINVLVLEINFERAIPKYNDLDENCVLLLLFIITIITAILTK